MSRYKQKVKQGMKKLSDIINLDGDSLHDGIDIEIISDRYVSVDGCISIEEYTDDIVIFKGKNMSVKVSGEKIELYTFANGRIRASGKIHKIELDRGDSDD